jgi:hypothetical protein
MDDNNLLELGFVGVAILTTLLASSTVFPIAAYLRRMIVKFGVVVVLQDRKLYGATRPATPQRLIVGL